MPLKDMQDWLIADHIESFVANSETEINIEDVKFEELYPNAPGTLKAIFDEIVERKGHDTLYEDMNEESISIWRERRKKEDEKWSKE